MNDLNIDFATLSKIGGREQNQDSLAYKNTEGCHYFVLADGLGGYEGGAKAAKIAISSMMHSIPTTVEQLAQAFENAHQAIHAAQQENHGQTHKMASTLVALMINQKQAIWGHVGDARIYWIRNESILYQSKDHSIPQLLVSDGEISPEQIRHHPDRNRLHKALGDTHKQIQPRLSRKTELLQSGDVFLLCSDGFWEWITEEEMLADLVHSSSSQQWLETMEARLLRQATGKIDNYSAISVFC